MIGAFAEESVKELIKRVVFPYRVSTGSIVSKSLLKSDEDLAQIDCIIWNPSPFPALFEKGNFGLITNQSCIGFLEIKSSNYSNVGKAIELVLKRENEFVEGGPPKLRKQKLIPDQLPKSLGIVCLYDKSKSDPKLKELINENRVSVILEHSGDFDLIPNRKGILNLIDFLRHIRRRGQESDGYKSINVDLIENSA